jgi:heat-inducible transcription repressor hrcA
VTATYEIEEGVYGKIGIVGPKRMDYAKVVGSLKNLMRQLDSIFKHQSEDKTTKAIKLIDMKNDINYVSDT